MWAFGGEGGRRQRHCRAAWRGVAGVATPRAMEGGGRAVVVVVADGRAGWADGSAGGGPSTHGTVPGYHWTSVLDGFRCGGRPVRGREGLFTRPTPCQRGRGARPGRRSVGDPQRHWRRGSTEMTGGWQREGAARGQRGGGRCGVGGSRRRGPCLSPVHTRAGRGWLAVGEGATKGLPRRFRRRALGTPPAGRRGLRGTRNKMDPRPRPRWGAKDGTRRYRHAMTGDGRSRGAARAVYSTAPCRRCRPRADAAAFAHGRRASRRAAD